METLFFFYENRSLLINFCCKIADIISWKPIEGLTQTRRNDPYISTIHNKAAARFVIKLSNYTFDEERRRTDTETKDFWHMKDFTWATCIWWAILCNCSLTARELLTTACNIHSTYFFGWKSTIYANAGHTVLRVYTCIRVRSPTKILLHAHHVSSGTESITFAAFVRQAQTLTLIGW